MKSFKGFTLIELLIVVAIIAILAAIAVPNFLEAQTRSRVSRAENDLRTIALAMEAYHIDNGTYIPSRADSPFKPGTQSEADANLLTTPIAYVNSKPDDVFRSIAGVPSAAYRIYAVNYGNRELGKPVYNIYPYSAWMTWSYGPDLVTNVGGYWSLPSIIRNEAKGEAGLFGLTREGKYIAGSGYAGLRYDPTNGTISYGDIHRIEGMGKTSYY